MTENEEQTVEQKEEPIDPDVCPTCSQSLTDNQCINEKCPSNICDKCQRPMDIVVYPGPEGFLRVNIDCINYNCISNQCPYCGAPQDIERFVHYAICMNPDCPGPHVQLNNVKVKQMRTINPDLMTLIEGELKKRESKSPAFLRLCSEVIISHSLSNAVIYSLKGNIRPNIMGVFIAPSGYGKSPVMRIVKDIVDRYNKIIGIDWTPELFNHRSMIFGLCSAAFFLSLQ